MNSRTRFRRDLKKKKKKHLLRVTEERKMRRVMIDNMRDAAHVRRIKDGIE